MKVLSPAKVIWITHPMERNVSAMPVLRNHTLLNHLQMRIRGASDWRRSADFNISKRLTPYTLIWYVQAGSKLLYINDRAVLLKKGDMLVLPSNTSFMVEARNSDQLFHHFSLTVDLKIGDF